MTLRTDITPNEKDVKKKKYDYLTTEINQKYKPTIGLLNPPYNDSTGLNELEFVLNNLEAIEKMVFALQLCQHKLNLHCKFWQ